MPSNKNKLNSPKTNVVIALIIIFMGVIFLSIGVTFLGILGLILGARFYAQAKKYQKEMEDE